MIDALLRDGFVPFAFGAADNLARLDPEPLGVPLTRIPADVPDAVAFHRALLRLNALAFGELAMPPWVQLDLGVLPSVFVGWALAPERLPSTLADDPALRSGSLVPVAETLAVPTLVPGRFMSCSMASLIPERHLGLTAKLLGLVALRAVEALGVTQLDSPALRAHTRLGPLDVLQAHLPVHPRPWSFLYRLHVDLDHLDGVAHGRPTQAATPTHILAPDAAQRHLRAHGGRVVAPGLLPDGPRVSLA